MNKLHRKSEIVSWKGFCAKFYFIHKYLSTLERMFRIARCFAYWSLRCDDMRLCEFLIQSLGSFYFKKMQKQGDSCSYLAIYPFQSLYIIYIQTQTYSCLSRSELVQTPCLWLVMIVYHYGLYTYTIITPRSSMRLHKALHPPERKKKRNTRTAFMPVQVKKKKGEEWKMLEYHWGFTFLLHLDMTRVMDLLTTMRHYVCTCKMNV